MPALRRLAPPLALAAVGLAFLLRLYRLPDQNVWFDEGWTVWLSRMDLMSLTLRAAADTHPPLSFWLTHFWEQWAGASAFSLRLLSVYFGILTVAVMFRIGRHTGGPALGLLAALVLVPSRLHIWWSQEIRDYTQAGFFALCAVWFTLRLLTPPRAAGPRWRLWAGYLAATLAAIFTHHLAVLVVLADNLLALVVLVPRHWRRGPSAWRPLGQWALAQMAVAALFAPWLVFHLSRAITRAALPLPAFETFLRLSATLYTVGVTYNIEAQAVPVAALLLLAGAGALWALWGQPGAPGLHSRLGRAAVIGLLLLALPTVVIYLLALTPAAPFIPQVSPRYLLIFLPGFSLLAALALWAVARRRRLTGLALLVGVVALQAAPLRDYYAARRLRDDYFTLANVINAFAQPGDVVLFHTDHEWSVPLFYLHPSLSWDGVLSGAPVGPAYAASLAQGLVETRSRIWLVTVPDALAKDPDHLVAAELARRLPVQFTQTFGDKQLTLYAAAPEPAQFVPARNFAPQHPRQASLGANLTLLGYDQPLTEARGGDTLQLVTYWDAAMPHTVTVSLRWPTGAETASLAALVPAGQLFRLQSDLRLPPGAKGRYHVEVAAGGDSETLGTLTAGFLHLPDPSDLDTPTNYDLGGLVRLAGYTISDPSAAPGGYVRLVLFWTSLAPLPQDYKVFVHLLGNEFNPTTNTPLWGQVDQLPLDGSLPMPTWPPGELIRDPYSLLVDEFAPPGRYNLEVGLYDGLTGERLSVVGPDGAVADHILLDQVEILPDP